MEISTNLGPSAVSDEIELLPLDNQRLASLCGQFDEHIKMIEKYFDVYISNRPNSENTFS